MENIAVLYGLVGVGMFYIYWRAYNFSRRWLPYCIVVGVLWMPVVMVLFLLGAILYAMNRISKEDKFYNT